jgi:hypothetical protein
MRKGTKMEQNLSDMIAANATLIQPVIESSTNTLVRSICNNSTFAMKLVNASGEIILQQLEDNSLIIIKINNPTQSILNWSTMAGVILGWVLSEIGRRINDIRIADKQDKRLLALLNQDWISNKSKMQRNISLINQEIEILQTNKHVVVPLELLEMSFWNIIKYNLPNRLIDDDRMVIIRDIAARTNRINERVQSRENFRISNLAMSNFHTSLGIYNKNLVDEIKDLIAVLDEEQPNFTYERLHVSNYDRLNEWWLASYKRNG